MRDESELVSSESSQRKIFGWEKGCYRIWPGGRQEKCGNHCFTTVVRTTQYSALVLQLGRSLSFVSVASSPLQHKRRVVSFVTAGWARTVVLSISTRRIALETIFKHQGTSVLKVMVYNTFRVIK